MPTVADLWVDGVQPADIYVDGHDIARVYVDGALRWSDTDVPRITAFDAAPTFGAASAPTVGSFVNFAWDTEGTVATATLESRRSGSSDAWNAETVNSPGNGSAPWERGDTDYRLTVDDGLGETNSRTITFYRTVPPAFTAGDLRIDYRHVFVGQDALDVRIRWQLTQGHPNPVMSWTQTVPGHHLNDPNRAMLPDLSGEVHLTIALGDDPLSYPITLQARNPVSGETATASGTIAIPARGGG